MPTPMRETYRLGRTNYSTVEGIALLTQDILCLPPDAHDDFSKLVQESLKQHGFLKTLKDLEWLARAHKSPTTGILKITDGILKFTEHGYFDGAITTERGHLLVVQDTERHHRDDVQVLTSFDDGEAFSQPLSASTLLSKLANSKDNILPGLICEIELAQFGAGEREKLLPLLWKYIGDNKNSGNRDILTAVGSAIRKFVALMPMDRMGELSLLLEPSNHELPLELELEVTKMVFRNFEVNPPNNLNTEPVLADRLFDLATAYVNPRVLLRDKYSSVASLAIEGIVAMRSEHSAKAWHLALQSQHKWFSELISDDLLNLEKQWRARNTDAAKWLYNLRAEVVGNGGSQSANQT